MLDVSLCSGNCYKKKNKKQKGTKFEFEKFDWQKICEPPVLIDLLIMVSFLPRNLKILIINEDEQSKIQEAPFVKLGRCRKTSFFQIL